MGLAKTGLNSEVVLILGGLISDILLYNKITFDHTQKVKLSISDEQNCESFMKSRRQKFETNFKAGCTAMVK